MFRQGVGDDFGLEVLDCGMRVIKLGGSLERSGALKRCLDDAARKDNVVVPGGGDFAEQVRSAQQRWHFDDTAAHAMAILAMQQMAWLLGSINRNFVLADSVAEIVRQLETGRPVIWCPDLHELDRAGIAASWDITSDSLAAWLAGVLGARELILIKSANIPRDADIKELVESGLVDPAFPSFTGHARFKTTIVNKDNF